MRNFDYNAIIIDTSDVGLQIKKHELHIWSDKAQWNTRVNIFYNNSTKKTD